MPRASANGMELEYDIFGAAGAAPLLLINGLGAQMIGWDDDFCRLLADRGFRIIRFDNRDVGLSTRAEEPYTLDDMADDAAGLLGVLGIRAANVVGASMGGFIAQLVALNHPDRVLSLTSIMSGPSGEDQVQPTDEARALLFAPAPETREGRIELGVYAKQKLLGPADPFDEPMERARIAAAIDRAYNPAGFIRPLQAIAAAIGRLERLRSLRVPTLVIHGDADNLVSVANGHSVAAAIPGARLVEIEGMGHDVPRRVWRQVADEITALARQAAAC